MARPEKERKVCKLPEENKFIPVNGVDENKIINLTIDEYEVIRLIDLEGLTQEEAASQMKVARTTVQRIYSRARRILAEFLVMGKSLKIEGGNYKVCNHSKKGCMENTCSIRGEK